MTASTDTPEPAPLDEARRLSGLALSARITARLLGGAAVALSAPGPLPQQLQRRYKDLDYVVRRADTTRWKELLEHHGYEADTRFNALHGSQRLLHYDRVNVRQLDTFVSAFAMCHTLDLEDRMPDDSSTLNPEDILLTKLQIFEVNDKDLIDTIALLLSHPIVSGDQHGVNRERFAKVIGGDWGWYTTISDNLDKVRLRLPGCGLDPSDEETVAGRIAELAETMRTARKTVRWRARAKIGRRLPWYDLPEEVE